MKKLLMVAIILIAALSNQSCNSSNVSSQQETPKTQPQPITPKIESYEWTYDSSVNDMGDKIVQISVLAKDLVYFDFPYNGGSQADLTVRKKNNKMDVIFYIDKGQIDTDYDGTYVRVKFDDTPPSKWLVNEAASGSSNLVFFDNQKGFISKLKNSKKVVIEVPFYQHGNKQFTFSTQNIKL